MEFELSCKGLGIQDEAHFEKRTRKVRLEK